MGEKGLGLAKWVRVCKCYRIKYEYRWQATLAMTALICDDGDATYMLHVSHGLSISTAII